MSPAKRSALMARIRGRDTEPEIIVRRLLHAMGYRFRLHARNLPGRPDIVLRSKRTAIFVHGCFWHRHNCGLAYMPKTRSEFWQKKFAGNVERDRRVKNELKADGWHVIAVWECQLGNPSSLAARLVKKLGPTGQKGKSAPVVAASTLPGTTGRIHVRARVLRPQRRRARSLSEDRQYQRRRSR